MDLPGAVRFGAQVQSPLDSLKQLPVNDSLMGALHPNPLFFGHVNQSLGLVAHLFPPSLEHNPGIHLVAEDAPDGGLVPQTVAVGHRVTAGPAVFRLVAGGIWDALVIEQFGDLLLAVALQGPSEDLPNHLGSLRLNNEMVVILRVFLIAVDGKSADVPPLPPLHVKNHADIFGQVLQIPLVDQAVDLPGLFVALYLRVGIVGYGDEPDAPDGKQAVDVFLHQLHIPGKAGLAFAEDNLKLFLLGRLNHPVEVGPQAVGAGVVLVAVDVVDVPPPLHCVRNKQGFLILDALGFRFVFVLVFFAQPGINRTKDRLHLPGRHPYSTAEYP